VKHVRVKRPLVFLCAAGLAIAIAPAARANGDPASDVLPFQTVFLSNERPSSASSGRELLSLTADAARKKLPIRVAVIFQRADLGLIGSLWRKPQTYANFLGRELIAFGRYHGTLLVAMPNGFGVFGPGATAKAKRRLASLAKPGSGSVDELGSAAADATRALAAARGVELSAAKTESGGTPAWVVILAVLGGAAAIAGVVFLALRRWLTRPAGP
jgi:hypothetical protein